MDDMKLSAYISENIDAFQGFIKVGIVSTSFLSYYKIYSFFTTTDKMPSLMDRYSFTAEAMNVKISTVRKAVKLMGSKLSPKNANP